MTADRMIGVCGFGRCGSTMLMHMLDAGGIAPVDGTAPGSYELVDGSQVTFTPGRAVKLLDAAGRRPLPRWDWQFIWLDRDPVDQAASAVKFLEWTAPDDDAARDMLRGVARVGTDDYREYARAAFAASFRNDRPMLLAKLRERGPVLTLSYERVLANPRRAVRALAALLPVDWDRDAAAAVVHDRDGTCRPDCAIEAALTDEA